MPSPVSNDGDDITFTVSFREAVDSDDARDDTGRKPGVGGRGKKGRRLRMMP